MGLTQGRFYDEYGASMDAALSAKLIDIEPNLIDGLVVDRGCGTGSLMFELAKRNRKVVGIEISEELSALHPGVILADVSSPVFADSFVQNIILSSVCHEIYSYSNPKFSTFALLACLANCTRELCPNGRIIIRDIWSPEIDSNDTCKLLMDIDTFEKFLSFQAQSPVPPEISMVNTSTRTAIMSTRTAVEFLSKKDYLRHWKLELNEMFSRLPISLYTEMAHSLKLSVVTAEPIVNKWILDNRWNLGVTGDIPKFTNQLIVLAKADQYR